MSLKYGFQRKWIIYYIFIFHNYFMSLHSRFLFRKSVKNLLFIEVFLLKLKKYIYGGISVPLCVCLCVCTHVCRVCVHTYVYMHACKCVCACVYVKGQLSRLSSLLWPSQGRISLVPGTLHILDWAAHELPAISPVSASHLTTGDLWMWATASGFYKWLLGSSGMHDKCFHLLSHLHSL